MFCRNCGSQIPDGAGFCPSCGSPVSPGGPFANPVGGGYAPQQNPVPPAGYGGPVDSSRSLLSWALLTIITCGIYNYYFIYKLAQDLNTMCLGDGEETPGLLAFILLSFVTCGFYTYYWYYKIGNRLQRNAPRYGLAFQENGTTILLWQLVGALLCCIGPFIAMHIIITNTNAMAAAYNARYALR